MTAAAKFDQMRQACLNRPHGTRDRYMAGCRCVPCRAANSRYACERAIARSAGDWNGIVDAAPARKHLRKLSASGVGRDSVAAATGISGTILFAITSGERRQIRARTLRKILATDQSIAGDHALVDAGPTWKLLDVLLEDGYSKAQIARWLGLKCKIQFRRHTVTVRNAHKVQRMYDDVRAGRLRRDR